MSRVRYRAVGCAAAKCIRLGDEREADKTPEREPARQRKTQTVVPIWTNFRVFSYSVVVDEHLTVDVMLTGARLRFLHREVLDERAELVERGC